MNVKIGDVVEIRDCSWARVIKNSKLSYEVSRFHWTQTDKPFVVVSTECDLPVQTRWGVEHNNTIIQGKDSGVVIFIESRFLQPFRKSVEIEFFANGQNVTEELSPHCKQEILKTHLQRQF